jgi:protein-L-isoaspartate(D-aspartate) O-methyltransferase
MSTEQAQFNMVEQQIRPWDVLDQNVLDLMASTPRADYVPELRRGMAFMDVNIPLGHGAVMLQPKMEARLLQALDITKDDKILLVGTGTGHLASLLAQLGKHVTAVDINSEFTALAEKNLAAHNISNVSLETGDAASGWDASKPYDVIFISGSLPALPDSFRESLNIGGRMIAIVGKAPVMETRLIRRNDEKSWSETALFETEIPALVNAGQVSSFEF